MTTTTLSQVLTKELDELLKPVIAKYQDLGLPALDIAAALGEATLNGYITMQAVLFRMEHVGKQDLTSPIMTKFITEVRTQVADTTAKVVRSNIQHYRERN